jgi:hypothetical protein
MYVMETRWKSRVERAAKLVVICAMAPPLFVSELPRRDGYATFTLTHEQPKVILYFPDHIHPENHSGPAVETVLAASSTTSPEYSASSNFWSVASLA